MAKTIKPNKKTLAEPTNEQINLDFLPQLSLSGKVAIELLKDGTEMGKPIHLIVGNIGDLDSHFDLPMESYKLEPNSPAFVVYSLNLDRPIFVYQKSALAVMNNYLIQINSDGGLLPATEQKNHGGDVIGTRIEIALKNDGQFFGYDLNWERESDKKYGKYQLV